ncbi:hypothetical protein M9H77_06963 [Catharanthus roseus]|uniref:Uncharacterized protein n=1 Tax=Catharanthus roseus TaxID=4058 RepID=A0ACC0BTK3_CATRO|nr:hypothetical protein M9H77_06963 [Catharanthus roseus]
MKPSIIEEFLEVNELQQATIEVEGSVVLHVKEEVTNVEYCELMRDNSLEKVKSVELKLFFELYASYVTLVGNVMNNPFTCDLALYINRILKCSSPCAYLEKQLLFKVLKVHPCDLVITTFENGVYELTLKILDEKLVYPISFIDYLLKHDILKDFLVQNIVNLLNQSIGGILLYSLTFKEFLNEFILLLYCNEELGGLFLLKEMEHEIEWVTRATHNPH